MLDLVKRPIVSRLIGKKKWSKENAVSEQGGKPLRDDC